MPISLRKMIGTVSLFIIVCSLLVVTLSFVVTLNDLTILSFWYGELPTGKNIDFTIGVAAVLFMSVLGGFQASVVFFRFLSKEPNENRAALIAMLPVLLVVILLVSQLYSINLL
jgi:hypothetical protein